MSILGFYCFCFACSHQVSDADSHSSSSVLSIDSAFRQTDNVINLDANQPTDSSKLTISL